MNAYRHKQIGMGWTKNLNSSDLWDVIFAIWIFPFFYSGKHVLSAWRSDFRLAWTQRHTHFINPSTKCARSLSTDTHVTITIGLPGIWRDPTLSAHNAIIQWYKTLLSAGLQQITRIHPDYNTDMKMEDLWPTAEFLSSLSCNEPMTNPCHNKIVPLHRMNEIQT